MKLPASCLIPAAILGLGSPPRLPAADDSPTPPVNSPAKPRHTNRLAREKSPYLLQHQHNPVDWYPWGEEAFEKAKRENKPVLLSIGYSTCHWCHVMERESFESDAVAAVINEKFIAIKLDREERPDIDHIYMTAMQAVELGGGWPLNVFLTPDRQPFFGGTYFPKDRFIATLNHVDKLWKENQKELTADAENLTRALQKHMADRTAPEQTEPLARDIQAATARAFMDTFDPVDGGWGKAPKFPQPQVPGLLLLASKLTGDSAMQDQVLLTCRRMAAGGIFDHVGGGFARYSVDAQWLVPHFEKMLYDNAQLLELYLDAGLASSDAAFMDTARSIARYVQRDMTHKDGGWYSAEDADSEGHEGKFHCWTLEDFRTAAGPDDADWAAPMLGVTAMGNFLDHSHPEPLKGLNVLSLSKDAQALDAAGKARLASVLTKLAAARAKRIRPHLDDKILTSWNGLMLAAMARAGIILGDDSCLAAARKNFAFVRSTLWDPASKTLFHRWRDGGRDNAQLLSAYAFYLHGTVELYQATLDPDVLAFSIQLAEGLIEKFADPKEGGFFTSTASPDLLFRAKDDYDGAEPSGNAMAVSALLRLAAITENAAFRSAADKALRFVQPKLVSSPQGLTLMLKAAAFASREPFRAVIAGDPASPEGRQLLAAAHKVYQPFRVILGTSGPVEPFALTLQPKDAKATAYVCTGKSCLPPTSDPASVSQSLATKLP